MARTVHSIDNPRRATVRHSRGGVARQMLGKDQCNFRDELDRNDRRYLRRAARHSARRALVAEYATR